MVDKVRLVECKDKNTKPIFGISPILSNMKGSSDLSKNSGPTAGCVVDEGDTALPCRWVSRLLGKSRQVLDRQEEKELGRVERSVPEEWAHLTCGCSDLVKHFKLVIEHSIF